jgi:hypothetical protein
VIARAQGGKHSKGEPFVMRPQLLCWQSYALSALCLGDLASTVWLCNVHDASEGNPLMAFFLAQGVVAFAAAKIALTAIPLGVLEWARRLQPKLGTMALNTALLGYLTLYGAGLAHVNGGNLSAEAARVARENQAHIVFLETQRRIAAKRSLKVAKSSPAPTLKTLPAHTANGLIPSTCAVVASPPTDANL